MSNLSYGSITITDLTDLGQLSAQIAGNMPNTVIYDEDQNSFNPDWSVSATNLQLSPIILYGGTSLSGNASGLTVTWKKKIGTGEPAVITSGINSSTKVLTVSDNPFSVSSPNVMPSFITYILEVRYADSSLGLTQQNALQAESRITFSLLTQHSSLKSCKIMGESIFSFDQFRQIKTGFETITLTSSIRGVGVSIDKWYYKNGQNWVAYPGTNNTNTLTVSYNDNVFFGDKAIIKLQTSDANIYDIHNILRLYDGAPGTKNILGALTNDDQVIPADSSGVPAAGGLAEAKTEFQILEGGINITSQYQIQISSSPQYNATTFKYSKSKDGTTWVNGNTNTTDYGYNRVRIDTIGNDVVVGNITFRAKKNLADDSEDPITRTFSISKVKTGLDGISPAIYSLNCSAIAVNKTAGDSPSFNPSTVTVTGQKKVGNPNNGETDVEILKGGTIIITDANGQNSHTFTASSEGNTTYTIANQNPTLLSYGASTGFLIVSLYDSSGKLLDNQRIIFTPDGTDGQPGQQGPVGPGAINMDIGNPAEGIPCTNNYKTIENPHSIVIPFRAFQGGQKVACTLNTQNLGKIAGVTGTVVQPSSQNGYEGSLSYSIPQNTTLPTASGTIVMTFTVGTQTVTENFTWAANLSGKDGIDGKNAVILRLYTPNGTNTFVNETPTSITLEAILTEGSNTVTSSGTDWIWKKYKTGSGYVQVDKYGVEWDGTTNASTRKPTNSITINKDSVNSYASYQCSVKYGTNSDTYTEYFSIFDKSDPIQINVMCSFGEQITNGQGVGALYVIVTRNGQEIDNIKTKVFSETAPSAVSGSYYYKLDKTNKTISLMKSNGSTWTDVTSTEQYTGNYEWSFRDKDGNELTTNIPATNGSGNLHKQKVIYIDGTFINKKIIADVAVTI